MPSKHLQALKEKTKARIDNATDAEEVAALKEELEEIEAADGEMDKLLKAYKTAIKTGQDRSEDDREDEDDDADETEGKGKKPLTFEQAFAKIEAKRKKGA